MDPHFLSLLEAARIEADVIEKLKGEDILSLDDLKDVSEEELEKVGIVELGQRKKLIRVQKGEVVLVCAPTTTAPVVAAAAAVAVGRRSTEERKRGRPPKADAVGDTRIPVTLKMLQERFGSPQYVPIKDPVPLAQSGKVFDRASTAKDFGNHVKWLLSPPSDKGSDGTQENREHYPLLAVNAPPGMGKTFILHLLAKHCNARPANLPPMLPVLLSFGDDTLVQAGELQFPAEDAIVSRILHTLFQSSEWLDFLHFCQGYRMPMITEALEMVREASQWEGAFLLLVDESAASTKLPGGNSFSSQLLTTLGLAQQGSVKRVAEKEKGNETAIFVVATSLRRDIIEEAMSSSGRPITLLGCSPLSEKSRTELLKEWTDRLHRKMNKHQDRLSCKRYVKAHLVYSGGVPRAVQVMFMKIFGPPSKVTLDDHYSFPTWMSVCCCLRGQRIDTTSQEMAVAMSSCVYFSPEGVPVIPLFQLARWARTVATTDPVEKRVAEIIRKQVPLGLPRMPADVYNLTGMMFERVTQVFEQVQHELLHNTIVPLTELFPFDGFLTNAPKTALVRLHRCGRDGDTVCNYPQDVTTSGHLDQFLKGERLVVPTNPNNAADYGCVVEYGPSASSQMRFTQQDSRNEFTAVPVELNVKDICDEPLLTESKLRLIFLYTTEIHSDTILPPATEEAVTVVVTHKGSHSLLGGLGGIALAFAQSDPN